MYGRMTVRALAALLLAGGVLAGCERDAEPEDQATGSVTGEQVRGARQDWPAGAGAHLDSANAAFAAEDHQGALRHYQAMLAMDDAPRNVHVTAWFGVYMTQSALGDTAAANAAAARLQELAPDASLMHGNPMSPGSAGTAPVAPNDSIHRQGQGQ
jgi:tetratricopeptide (TPR) repeat protein